MKMRGKLKGVTNDYMTGRWSVTFELTEGDINEVRQIQDKDLTIEAKQWRKHRSRNANAMLWACLGEIATALHTDKWDLYLNKLRECGQYTLIEMEPQALPKFREMYRECEDIGSRTVDGKEMRQVLCYYGSSTYNSQEFSILLESVIEDMKAAGLPTPTSQEMQRAIEELEAQEHAKAQKQAADR